MGSTAYVDPNFDRDHAARWGMMVDVPDVPIGDLVDQYQPDVVVEMLGVNDLIFGGRSPETVANRVAQFVDEARSAEPDVDLVLVEATQTWWTGVTDFNALLTEVAASASTDTSSVTVATAATGFDRVAHTWDDSHPNAVGEVRIAAAVADSLAVLGVGPPATRPLPVVPLGPRSAPILSATSGNGMATLSWTGPPGATAQYVWGRDVTAGEEWSRLSWPVSDSPWTALLLANGHRYRFKLQPVKGDEAAAPDVRSRVVEVLPDRLPARVAKPRIEPRLRALRVRWPSAPRATSYELSWWPIGRPSAVRTRSTSATSARLGSVSPRKRYAVTVRGRNDTGIGRASPAAVARPRRR